MDDAAKDNWSCRYWIKSAVKDYCWGLVKECGSECTRYGSCGACSFFEYSKVQEPCKSCKRKETKKNEITSYHYTCR